MRYKRVTKKGESIIDPFLDQVLYMNNILDKETYEREIETLQQKFASGKIERPNFPFKLDNTDEFIDLLEKNLNKKIVIVGDYDVDGVAATSIAHRYLSELDAKFDWIIPNRFEDGYGLKEGMVDKAISKGAELIITVDNGIKSKDAISYSLSKGVPVLVTDHHQPDEENFPHDAEVVVNPHVDNTHMQFKEICGAMVIFTLFYHHMVKKGYKGYELNAKIADSYDIAAVATVSDVMPMRYENRDFVQSFVERVRANKIFNVGIKAMIEAQGVETLTFTSTDVGFMIGPLVNAPGRLVSADIGVEIMTTYSRPKAKAKSEECVEKNNQRKERTTILKEVAFDEIDEKDDVHVIYIEKANEGLIGITAGQITEKTGKPSFVFTDAEEGVKGSGRSPENFNLIKGADRVLKNNPEIALGYGGHSGAMGLSLKDVNALRIFKKEMNKVYSEEQPTELEKPYIEGKIFEFKSMEEISQRMKILEPFGEKFQYPLFRVQGKMSSIRLLGKTKPDGTKNKDHTMFYLEEYKIKFLWFRNVIPESDEGKEVEVFFEIKEGEFRGQKQYDAFVKDVRPV